MAEPQDNLQLDGVIETLIAASQPEKIILFGSQARGEAREDSDIDLLVIKDSFRSRREEMVRLDRAIRKFRLPVEVVVVSTDEVRRFGDIPGHLLHPALREGKLLYERRKG